MNSRSHGTRKRVLLDTKQQGTRFIWQHLLLLTSTQGANLTRITQDLSNIPFMAVVGRYFPIIQLAPLGMRLPKPSENI